MQGLFWHHYSLLLLIARLWLQLVDYSQEVLGLSKRKADNLLKV